MISAKAREEPEGTYRGKKPAKAKGAASRSEQQIEPVQQQLAEAIIDVGEEARAFAREAREAVEKYAEIIEALPVSTEGELSGSGETEGS